MSTPNTCRRCRGILEGFKYLNKLEFVAMPAGRPRKYKEKGTYHYATESSRMQKIKEFAAYGKKSINTVIDNAIDRYLLEG